MSAHREISPLLQKCHHINALRSPELFNPLFGNKNSQKRLDVREKMEEEEN